MHSTHLYNERHVRHDPYHIQEKALARDHTNDYFFQAIRHALDRIMGYFEIYSTEGDGNQRQKQLQEVSLVISHAAAACGSWKWSSSNRAEYDAPEHLLSAAASVGNLSLVEHLLEQEPDSFDVSKESDVLGTPLRNASRNGHLKVVRLLLSKGADWEAGRRYRDAEEEWYTYNYGKIWKLQQEFFVSIERPYTPTALEAAVFEGHERIVRLLLQQPSHHNWRSSYSHLRAITLAAMRGSIDFVRLLDKEIGEFSPPVLKDLWNHTLLAAAFSGKTEVIPFLLAKGAQIDSTEFYERSETTALGIAALRGHNDTIRLLLENGANIDGGPKSEEVPLSLAAHVYGFPRTVALLLDKGAPVHPVRSRLLEQAVFYSPLCVIEVLLEKGVHKIREDGGAAALMAARDEERQDIVALFKEYGIVDGK